MYTLKSELESRFRKSFNVVGIASTMPILLIETTKIEFGDYQVNGIMAAAKLLKLKAQELAQAVVAALDIADIACDIKIAGAGFINFKIKDKYLINYLSNAQWIDLKINHKHQTVIVDLSSPNLAKEMHVGHLRSTVIGDCLARMHEYVGNTVIRQNHVGDWGTQFGMLTAYLVELGENASEFELNDLEDFYRKAKIRFDQDSDFANLAREYVVRLQSNDPRILELWQRFREISLLHCQKIYDLLEIKLSPADVCGESFYNDKLAEIIALLKHKSLLIQSGGANCVFFTTDELNTETPFIVQKKDGAYLYSTTDLAAINYRINNLKANRILYVVDSRQALHFKQLFLTATKSGINDSQVLLEHVSFGTMMGEDGKPFRTRAGTMVKLIDLIEEAVRRAYQIIQIRNPTWTENEKTELARAMAISAIKYADLSKNRNSDYTFSFDKMLAFEGNTAPYLMYAYTRIQSLFAKLSYNQQIYPLMIENDSEHQLSNHLAKFSDMLYNSLNENAAHYLTLYLYNLASYYMRFYESSPISTCTSTELKNSRLYLSKLCAQALKAGFKILGLIYVRQM